MGKCRRMTTNTTECLMYKNECSFGCTITMFAALAAIVPSVRNSEKLTDGVRPSGAANIVIVHPNEQPKSGQVPDWDVPSRHGFAPSPESPQEKSPNSKNQTLLLFHFL